MKSEHCTFSAVNVKAALNQYRERNESNVSEDAAASHTKVGLLIIFCRVSKVFRLYSPWPSTECF